jgi:hypothetical protein
MESIRKIPIDVSIKRWFLDMKGQVPDMIVQLIYIIRKIYKQANSRVEILVKGYADGQMTEWERPLRPGRYAYREIEVYSKFKPDSLNPFEYVHSTTTFHVSPVYGNKDLPNLSVTAHLKTHEFGQRRPTLISPHHRRRFLQVKHIRSHQHHRRRRFLMICVHSARRLDNVECRESFR